MITQQELKELLHYNPETGIFTWIAKHSKYANVTLGSEAGSEKGKAYYTKQIRLKGRLYSAASLIFLYTQNFLPSYNNIYHKDGDKLNLSLTNLMFIEDKKDITQEYLKLFLDYDPKTGLFTNRINRGKCIKMGNIAGCKKLGYIVISFNKVEYYAHRLAFLYMIGRFPDLEVDHINMVKDDNRWDNLRECAHHQNKANCTKQSNNKSGFKGVTLSTSGRKWNSYIRVKGKSTYLGSFSTPEEAAIAYNEAAIKLHGEFARLNNVKNQELGHQ